MIYLKIKRLIDIILSSIGIIILCPIFFIILIAIKIDSRGPVFFKQKRVGVVKIIKPLKNFSDLELSLKLFDVI